MKKLAALSFMIFVMAGQGVFAQDAKFNLDTPPGWTRSDTVRQSSGTMQVKLLSPSGLPEKGKKEIIQLLVQKVSPNMESMENKLKADAETFKENGRGQVTIDGTSADWFEITIKRKTSGSSFTERYYHFAKNGLSYMFICIIPGESFAVMQPQVDGVLRSFKVVE